MAVKNLTSLVNSEPTRQLTLVNHDGASHTAGDRGVIARSVFNSDQYGYVPLINKGLTLIYSDASANLRWALPVGGRFSGSQPGGAHATLVMPDGNVVVAAWADPATYLTSAPANEDLYLFLLSGTTGLITQVLIPSSSSNLDYNTSNPISGGDCIMGPVPGVDNFYICAVKHRSTSGRWTPHGFNYVAGVLQNGSISTELATQGQTAVSTTKCHWTMNAAKDELVICYADANAKSEFYTIPVTGTAGAYLLTAPHTIAEQIQWQQMGLMKCKAGATSHIHRLSNDSIICFGAMIAGTGTTQVYTGSGHYFINILDTSAVAITQKYYLDNEVPAVALTNKFYEHMCLGSWEIATDTYILLTKSSSKSSPTQGPDGEDFWSDGDGFNSVRAHKITITPGDNSMAYVDLGEFNSKLFKGNMFQITTTEEVRERSSVYDWALDISNTCLYMITKSYTTRLQFTASFAAADTDASAIQYSPMGPKQQPEEFVISTDVWSSDDMSDSMFRRDMAVYSEFSYAFSLDTKVLWCPMYIGGQNVASNYTGDPGLETYDMEQVAGAALQVSVVSSSASEVQVVTDFDVYANPGMTVGETIGNTFAVNAQSLIAATPDGNLLDLLVGTPFVEGSYEDFLYMLPEGQMMWNIAAVVPRINKGQTTGALTLGQGIWSGVAGIMFGSSGGDAGKIAAYEGPMWSWNDLDAPLWVWSEGGSSATESGNLMLSVEGWYAAGCHSALQTDHSSGGKKVAYKIYPAKTVEMNGRVDSNAHHFFFLKFGSAEDEKEAQKVM